MAALNAKEILTQSKVLVIKIGSSLLVDEAGAVRTEWLEQLVQDIAHLQKDKKILIVSSGAIAMGREVLGLRGKQLKLEESQAAAAVGQIHLAATWHKALGNIKVAQILLTASDTEERRRYLNARSTLMTLLAMGVVPVINENDTIATDEIRYGDNDRLAARVANIVSADCLLLLSTIDGLLTQDPQQGDGELIELVETITPDIEKIAGDRGSELNRGGMKAKLAAASIAHHSGCHMIIAQGLKARPLKALLDGGVCSLFPSPTSPQAARKIWISGLQTQGALTIDEGAYAALQKGKSLLPAGIKALSGKWERGALVSIKSEGEAGAELARGLIAYDSTDAEKIIGHKSDAIENILGYRGRQAMVHRDDLVLLSEAKNG